jgi:phosphoribosyl-ATP pyrophosphohydrolase
MRQHCNMNNLWQANLRSIISHHGVSGQIDKAVEEAHEFVYAITHNDIENIKEEIADLLIMIEQIAIIFNIHKEEIENIKYEKIARTLNRIKSEGQCETT